jgi:hypothetical protein
LQIPTLEDDTAESVTGTVNASTISRIPNGSSIIQRKLAHCQHHEPTKSAYSSLYSVRIHRKRRSKSGLS